MGYIARLRKGAAIFDLDGTNGVGLMDDFSPPAAQMENNISAGTGANFYGGGEFISRKAGPLSFYFTVRSMATSNALAEQQVDRLANFLALAGDKRDPVWFEFRPDNNVSFEPLWGQRGAFRRVEVLALEGLEKSGYASLGIARNRVVIAAVTITVNMPVLGNRQRVCRSYAAIEDWMGSKDGKSRGIIVPEITTNKMTNPVFGSATYSTGWTANAGLIMSKNIDPDFVLFGNVSAKVIAKSTDTVYQTITVGNTNKHSAEFYVKRPDGAAVSAGMVEVYYGAAKTTTFTAVGNGWYKVSAVNFDGINAATAIGLTVAAGQTLYISGAMLIEKAYNVPMCYGDMIGCTWGGTAHASTSARTSGQCWLPVGDSTMSYGQWTIRLVWKADRTITGVEKAFFCDGTPNLKFTFTAADKWKLEDGTNAAESAVLSIVAGTTYTFHLTANSAGMVVYLNGASIATGSYTPPAVPTGIFIGCDNNLLKQPNGTFMGFTTYDRAMTQTEVTADYNNILPIVTADKRVDWIVNDHDDTSTSTIYNCNDATHTNYFVVNGIPGDVPAEMQLKLYRSPNIAKSIWIGNHVDDYNHWINPLYRFYLEGSGTATAATDSGSAVLTIGIPTAAPRTGITRAVNFPDRVHGTFHFFARMRSAANTNTVVVGFYILYNGGYIYSSDKTVEVTTASKWFYIGKLRLEPAEAIDPGELTLTLGINFASAEAADDLLVDFAEVINGDLCVIKQYTTDAPGGGGSASYPNYVWIMGHEAYFDTNNQIAKVIGDGIGLAPEANNTLFMSYADDAGAHTVADALSNIWLDIIPRWITA